MKLYHYDHCPYCVKARMIFGLKHVPVDVITLLNDDEETPNELIGQKMVPILQIDDELAMPESMDIVHYVDGMDDTPIIIGEQSNKIAEWVTQSKDYMYPLVMPRWVKAPLEEFETQSARDYFTKKKEAYIGSFDDAISRTDELVAQANAHLKQLDALIHSENTVNTHLSDDDFHVFAALRSLSIVRQITFPPKLRAYMENMSVKSKVELHEIHAI